MQEITVYDIDDNALVDLVQWDSNVKIFVKEDGIDAAYNVHFFNCKSTDAMVMESAYSNGILSTVIPNDLLMDSHPITGYIYVEKNDEHKSVYCFRLVVRKRPKPSNYIYVDQKEYITFDKILQEAQKYANESKGYSEKAKESETNASTYANTASQKATEASSSAIAAKASETASKESETNAAASMDAAKISENNAAKSAENADASKAAAKESQDAAATSEQNAKVSETASKKSEDNAALSAENANESKEAAKTSESEAAKSAVEAKKSQDAAKISEDNAAISEKNAFDKADEASTSATTATAKATEASDSATLAKSWAEGGTGARDGEDTNNAKYHSEQSKNSSELSKSYLEKVEQAGNEAVDKIQNALDVSAPNFIVDLSTGHLMYSGERFAFLVNKAGHLEWGLIV